MNSFDDSNSFIQTGPTLNNPYENDRELKELIAMNFKNQKEKDEIEKDLLRFGERLITDIADMAMRAESNPPALTQYSPWGQRIDKIVTDKAWDELHEVSASEGIIAIGYERKYRELSRLYQFAKLYLYHPSSAFYTCPLAMTDGAAKLMEAMNDKYLLSEAYPHIISRNPKYFWTSGQWMTERSGGSDVSKTETRAFFNGNHWELSGIKWFTSATTSEMAMALARIVDANGNSTPGNKGLGLFYLKLKNDDGTSNGVEVLRLKDKLGTRACPTAELKLTNSKALLVGEAGEGVKNISHLLNVTRLYNSCTSIGSWRRLLNLSCDYAHKRQAFKKEIAKFPLHKKLLNECKADFSAAFQLTFFTGLLLGQEEVGQEETCQETCQEAQTNGKLLRLLTPITKLLTAKRNLIWTSELIESFGGAGFIEDTGIPKFLRDAQVLSIWEGTTNVLSLDMIRALKDESTLQIFIEFVENKTQACQETPNDFPQIFTNFKNLVHNVLKSENLELHARSLSFLLGDFLSLALMIQHTDNFTNTQNSNNLRLFYHRLKLRLQNFEYEIENSTIFTHEL